MLFVTFCSNVLCETGSFSYENKKYVTFLSYVEMKWSTVNGTYESSTQLLLLDAYRFKVNRTID